jgi:hypothetical protein
MVWWRMKVRELRPLACRGSSAFGGQPSWIVTTKVVTLLNIYILGDNQWKEI